MKKKDIFIIVLLIYLLIQIVEFKKVVFEAGILAIDIWKNNLVPSLLPFFIISNILINYNIGFYLSKLMDPIFTKIYKINSNSTVVLIFSMISGFPSNAKYTREMYENGSLSKKEAEKILIFSHFSNPLFILGTLAVMFLKNEKLGFIILISHVLGNFILGFIFRDYAVSGEVSGDACLNDKKFSKIFVNSVKKGMDSLILILGTLISFLVLSKVVVTKINTSVYNEMLITGLFEVTSGLKYLASLNLSDIYKTIISTFFLSFGGLCVQMQVISSLDGTGISWRPYMVGRVLHGIISSILAFLLYMFYFGLFW